MKEKEKITLKETYHIISHSEEFKNFLKENPDAELCTGFFILDFFGNDIKKSLDYKVGERIISFSINELGEIKTYEDKLIEDKNRDFPELEKIDHKIKLDLDETEGIAKTLTLDKGISARFNKIIAVLQKYNGKETWNLTCMLEGLIIVHILIDAMTGELIKFERKSMMDLIKKK
ncbi:MAG: hypothetical protein Q8N99_04180 [Nanoarchaeota archaeon]|nr:hypothetical protein [Nanoarchaeota archaeon]